MREGTPVVNKNLTKISYKRKGTRGGGGGPVPRCAGGVTQHRDARPPPHTLHKLDGVERMEVKFIVQSPFIDINNPKVPWPKIYTKNP